MTAQGTTFINLEDETGLMNVVVSKGCWARYRRVARGAAALLVRGRLERADGVVNIVAEELVPLDPEEVYGPGVELRPYGAKEEESLRQWVSPRHWRRP